MGPETPFSPAGSRRAGLFISDPTHPAKARPGR